MCANFQKILMDRLGEICQNVNYDVIGGHWRSNRGQIEVASKIRWYLQTLDLEGRVCANFQKILT